MTAAEAVNVNLVMRDFYTGQEVTRSIDKINAYTNGSTCWELRDAASQRKALEAWIEDRGNEQHDTILELVSWSFS